MITELDLDALAEARIVADRRTPDGQKMTGMRWAHRKGVVWTFPASYVRSDDMKSAASHVRLDVSHPKPVAHAFWLCTAARQDLWRALQGVPGLLPVIHAKPEAEPGKLILTLGCVVPPKRMNRAINAVLEDIYQPRRVKAWLDWAAARAGGADERAAGKDTSAKNGAQETGE